MILSDDDITIFAEALEDAIDYNKTLVDSEMIPCCPHEQQPKDVHEATVKVKKFEKLRSRI